MAILDWREVDQVKKVRAKIVESWAASNSFDSRSADVAVLIGLSIGHYIPLLVDTAEFWRDEASSLRRQLQELKVSMAQTKKAED